MSLAEGTKSISVVMIIEVIGKPPEHLTETLDNLIKQIGEEKGVEVRDKNIKEPAPMKDQEEFYTSFAEVEVEVETISHLAGLLFKYMPSHVEIISPEFIALTNNGWNDIFNELSRRLHGYDEIARIIQIEKVILEKKVRELMGKNKEEREKKNGKEDD